MRKFFSSKLFVFILFVIVVVATIILSNQSNQNERQPLPIQIRPTSLPSIDRSAQIPGAPSDVAISGLLPGTDMPISLPVYRVRFDEPRALARRLATVFSLGGEPTVLSEGPPIVWRWLDGDLDLTFQLKIPPVFSFRQPLVASTPKNTDIEQPARDFIARVASLPQGVTLSLVDSQAVPPSIPGSNTPSPNAGIISMFRYRLGQYPLFLLPNTFPDITVFLDDERHVYRATATLPPMSIDSLDDRTLIEPRVAQDLILQNGILVSVGEEPGSSLEDSTSPRFSEVVVTNVEIVYYFLEEEQIIVPAYLFTGRASGSGTQRPFLVTYLIRATQ